MIHVGHAPFPASTCFFSSSSFFFRDNNPRQHVDVDEILSRPDGSRLKNTPPEKVRREVKKDGQRVKESARAIGAIVTSTRARVSTPATSFVFTQNRKQNTFYIHHERSYHVHVRPRKYPTTTIDLIDCPTRDCDCPKKLTWQFSPD